VAPQLALARIEIGTGRISEARSRLDEVLAVQTHNDEAHRLLGRLLSDQGQHEEALVHLSKALELRPTFAGNVEAQAWALFLGGRLEDAAQAYRRLTELQPDNAWAFQMLGSTQHALGRVGVAISNYRKAVSLGQDSRAYANLGLAYFEQKRFDEARQAYEQAVRLEPGLAALQAGLGDCYRKLDQRDKARDAYLLAVRAAEQDLRTNPNDGEALAALALYHAKLGDAARARRYASEAVRQSPSNASVNYQVAASLAILGDREAALTSLKKALELGYSRALAARDEDLAGIPGILDSAGSLL
jgi:tetratricopeptide (TPR) repeat protein